MRVTILLLISIATLSAEEIMLTPEEREKEADCIVEGTITKISFSEKLESDDLWEASIKVDKILKSDRSVKDTVAFYFDKAHEEKTGNGYSWSGRICPDYPNIKPGMKARFFMNRADTGSKKKVLIVYTQQWIQH